MANVVELAESDDPVFKLLDIASQLRRGELVGVTVVTTTRAGVVEMDTLCVPTYIEDVVRRA